MAKSYKDIRGEREITYVVCPLCGRNRVLEVRSEKAKAKGKGRLRWDFFDPETSYLVQIREAGGKLPSDQQDGLPKTIGKAKAIGFPLQSGLTWEEANRNGEFQDQIEAIRIQIKKLEVLLTQIRAF